MACSPACATAPGAAYALVYQQACEPSEGDDGLRLFGVILASHDGPPPDYIDPQSPGLDWLVRYQFSDSGDLIAVRDRLGQVVRVFAWREHMLVAHGEPGGWRFATSGMSILRTGGS